MHVAAGVYLAGLLGSRREGGGGGVEQLIGGRRWEELPPSSASSHKSHNKLLSHTLPPFFPTPDFFAQMIYICNLF